MAKEVEPYNLPIGPSDLCFDTNEFSKKSFTVDKFLQIYSRKANLEAMRDDLGIYLKVLRAAMIELINKDYADFVNLSTNLIGLDKAINGIQDPLIQLKDEVMQVKQSLDEAIFDISTCLNQRQELRCKKRSLQNLLRAQSSLAKLSDLLQVEDSTESNPKVITDRALMERAAAEFNQLQFCISKCSNYLPKTNSNLANKIGNLLTASLGDMFLKSVNSQDSDGISLCLRIYITLDKTSEVESLFRHNVVAPAMDQVIAETSLQSDPMGLRGVYSRILEFIDTHMKELLELTTDAHKAPKIKGFNFLVNSYWPEVEQRLEMHLSSIYAPGNPDTFFQRYSDTEEFLGRLERCCKTQVQVKVLRGHPQYSSFLQRWNLPVYFQIRFQEIAGSLETSLAESISVTMLKSGPKATDVNGFQLWTTAKVWDCLSRCWKDGVFIHQLMHRFWKLSLQIIARYSVWINEALNEKWPSDSDQATAPSTLVLSTPEVPITDNKKLTFLVSLYIDIEKLVSRLPDFLALTSRRTSSLSAPTLLLLSDSLKASEEQLTSKLPAVTQAILAEVGSLSLSQLRQVSDIPRLFRRTNREVPTKPCAYVSLVLSPPLAFHRSYESSVRKDVLAEWMRLTFSAVACQYHGVVNDVLTSVQKTEESLRRLKKIRDRASAATSSEPRGVGDDDKIRQQLAIDVLSFCAGVESLGLERKSIEKLDDLVTLVETARDKSTSNK